MSDAVDEPRREIQELLYKSRTHSLREQMRDFASQHESKADLKHLRETATRGKSLSEVIDEEREERL